MGLGKARLVVLGIIVSFWGHAPRALGWGSYGHEQINRVAARLLADTVMGRWMRKNEGMLQRLSVTPDYDWKRVGVPPTDPQLVLLRNQIDRYEHPLHYFEADAFLLNGVVTAQTIQALPTTSYGEAWQVLSRLLAANQKYVKEIDPDKPISNPESPTPKDVASHGTTPWRIAQLWQLGVDELKKGNWRLAMLYLGAMGHYVGDMSQPFHGALDYDGKAGEGHAHGIHAAYETKMLEILAKAKGAVWDKDTKIWSHLDATEATILELTRARLADFGKMPTTEAEILFRCFALIAEMRPYHAPLTAAFVEAIGEENEGAESIRVATVKAFMKKKIEIAGLPTRTPAEIALYQLAASTAFLNQLWASAFQVAGVNPKTELPKHRFDEALPIRNYPKPVYLPQLSGVSSQPRAAALTAAASCPLRLADDPTALGELYHESTYRDECR